MFMQVIHFIMDAGSSVFMPVIIFVLGLVFGLKPSKSFGGGICNEYPARRHRIYQNPGH